MARPKPDFPAAAAIRALAQALGIATSRLQMLRGATGRDKLVQIGE
jgi:uncharacterized protein